MLPPRPVQVPVTHHAGVLHSQLGYIRAASICARVRETTFQLYIRGHSLQRRCQRVREVRESGDRDDRGCMLRAPRSWRRGVNVVASSRASTISARCRSGAWRQYGTLFAWDLWIATCIGQCPVLLPEDCAAVEGRGADLYLGAHDQRCSRPGAHNSTHYLSTSSGDALTPTVTEKHMRGHSIK